MENGAGDAILAAQSGIATFCKFLSANDTGLTGGHQSGIYIPHSARQILFDEAGVKGSNKSRTVLIRWHDGTVTESRFIYYGSGTRNEYRITNFGRGFPWLRPDCTGALFVLVRQSPDHYQAFVMNTDEEITQFLEAFGLSATETNALIDPCLMAPDRLIEQAIERFAASFQTLFPPSDVMSMKARELSSMRPVRNSIPDMLLVSWIDMEYRLFRAMEQVWYGRKIADGFSSVEDFVATANEVLNRRKSRAGKSLEHHLSALFSRSGLSFTEQAVTEGNKRPDFLFPSAQMYHDPMFPDDLLITLAAKTTCKDRWRQVINEADRLRGKPKYLCTLQQGISPAQLDEMAAERVVLVVPGCYIGTYPVAYRKRIMTVSGFIDFVREKERLP